MWNLSCDSRVIFGVSSSPVLLNATIDHHMRKLLPDKQDFVDMFLRSTYVDVVTGGACDVQSAYTEASFNLRKFSSNSLELEQIDMNNAQDTQHFEDEPEMST